LSEEEPEQPQIGDLDLLFYDGRMDGDVDHLKLLDDPYLLVATAGTFPAGPVPLERLDCAPMVAWPLTCDRPWMEQAVARTGARLRIVFRTAVNDTLLAMVRAGMGSAVLPWLAIHGAHVASDTRLPVLTDAWFDVTTAAPGGARATAIAMAVYPGTAAVHCSSCAVTPVPAGLRSDQ
jgi:DNA-binding transcriptional LysR family regulator